MIYLDNSATTKPYPQVIDAMVSALADDFGNPSSLYRAGLNAEKIIKTARKSAADSMGADSDEIFFTSCGTESDNTAIKGVWESRRKQGTRIITTCVEHPAVLRCCEWLEHQGADVVYLPVSRSGKISAADFEKALTDDTILVSIMYVNNESGAVMPLDEIRGIMDKKKSKALLHTDAVQAWGKLPLDVHKSGLDIASFSGHKIHASKGVGVLYVKKGLHIPAFVHGGGQEGGMRSGTENVAGISGLGAACNILNSNLENGIESMRACRDHLKKGICECIDNVVINSPDDGAVSVLNVSFIGCRAEVLLHSLDSEGICVSTGSACSSHSHGSHVLKAMGLTAEQMDGAVRFSFCAENTIEEMDETIRVLQRAVESQRKLKKVFGRKQK